MFNTVILDGNFVSDPEMKFTANNAKVVKFAFANNRKYETANKEKKEESCFIDCEAWSGLADVIANFGKKGSAAIIEGRLKQDRWETENGKRSRHCIVLEKIKFLNYDKKENLSTESKPESMENDPF